MLICSNAVRADTIAYDVPLQPGNQAFTGNLGLDFDVNQSIVVTGMGAFDSGGDGFTNGPSVAFFNRDTQQSLGTSVSFIPGTQAPLVNGSRIAPLVSGFQFILTPGHYSIVAVGFSTADKNGNSTLGPPFTSSTENTGGGLISFVGSGRFDSNTTLDFPTTIAGGPSNVFLAGTFTFTSVQVPSLTKSFTDFTMPGGINAGETATLTFTLTNPNPASLTGVAFTDQLPPGLIVANPSGLMNTCGGTVIASGSNISVSQVNLVTTCTIGLAVTGVGGGPLTNTTSAVTSNEAAPGSPASASIYIYWILPFFFS
jgi:uncharacterized repeat protein (TIGR01451 family)